MRSITTKAICTLILTALIFGGGYWLTTAPWDAVPDPSGSIPSTSAPPTSAFPTTLPTTAPTTSTVPPVPTTTVHSHLFGQEWMCDEELHWNVCQCGEPANAAPHIDEDLDEKCDICDADVPLPPHEHSFGETWLSDEENHWNSCECGEIANVEAHIDEDLDEKCDICDADVPLPPHEHSFGETWLSDEENHWNGCECGEIINVDAHIDEDINGKCDVCDADVPLPPHEHSFGEAWLSDEENHWNGCECGEIINVDAHIDEDINGKCDVCDADVPLPPHVHSFSTNWITDGTNHWKTCECGEVIDTARHTDKDINGKCDICKATVPLPPEKPTLNGHSAFIFDCQANDYYYLLHKNNAPSDPIFPASTTKLFTAYIALKHLTLDEVIVLGDELDLVPKDASQTFGRTGFQKKDAVSVQSLLYSCLMVSGSDATYGLAVAAGRKILESPNAPYQDALDAFMKEMNDMAQRLGMGKTTKFITPDGYHAEDHVVSLHAFVTIARCAMSIPDIIAACSSLTVDVTYTDSNGTSCTKTLENTNLLLDPESEYYCPDAIGLKTGYTSKAGNCFLGLFRYGDTYVIIGTFGSSDKDKIGRWEDTIALWEYYVAYQEYLALGLQ